MAAPTLTDALSETLSVFGTTGDPGEPLTTAEVTEHLEVSRRSTYARLERLAKAGWLGTKKVGARGRVWWHAPSAVGEASAGATDGGIPDTAVGDTAGAPGVTGEGPTDAPAATDPGWAGAAESLVGDVLDRADVGVFVLDEEFQVVWINSATERYFGLDRNAVLGTDKRHLVEAEIGDRMADSATFVETLLGTYADNSDDERFECRVTAGTDRTARWLEHRSKPIRRGAYAGGRVELYYDITGQKEAERTHREQHRQFESLVDAVEEYAIFMLDPAGRVQTWNAGAARIKGYEDEEVLGEHVAQFYTDEAREADAPGRNLATAAREGAVEREGWRVRADGSRFWANVAITALRDGDGELVGFAKVTRDMTDHREYEQRLRAERDFSRQILETAPASIFVMDEDGTVVQANERLWQEFELDPDAESLSVGDLTLYDESGEPIPPPERPYRQVFETGEPVTDWRCRVELPSGERRRTSLNVSPVGHDRDDVETVVVAAQDVTQFVEQARQLERQRNEMRRELDDVFARVDDAFLAIDANWRLTYVNDQAADLLNLSVDGMLGTRVWDTLWEVADERPRELAEQAMDTQETVEYEYYSTVLERWFETRIHPSESGLSVYFRDVTDRKERERELEESRRRYQTLVEYFPNGAVALVDADLRYQTVGGTPVKEERTIDELEGSHVRDVLDPEIANVVAPRYEDALLGEASTVEAEFGDEVYRFRFVPVRDDDGSVFAALGMSQVITEQRRHERELREAKAQLEAATEAGEVGTWEYHVPEDRLVVGSSFSRTCGLDPDAAREGFPLDRFLSAIHEDDRDRVEREIETALESGGEYETEYRVENADGNYRWVVARGRIECDEDGRPVRFPGTLTDITERKRAELAQKRQREQLAAVNNLNEVVRNITEAAIEQSTRDEIEQVVCEALAASESYQFAWTGGVDGPSEEVSVRAEAGVGDYLDGITITVDPDDPRSEGPTGRALRTGEMQTTQDMRTDDRHDPWREHLEQYDVRSAAAIPLTHEGTVFGVLNVYADRANAFEGKERDVIGQLGEIVGHAIAAVERKRALMSDEVVELEFQVQDVVGALGIEADGAGQIELDEIVPVGGENYLVYGHASATARETARGVVEAVPHWENLRFQDQAGDSKFEAHLSEPPVLSTLASLGGSVESATIDDGDYHMTLRLSPSADLRQLIDSVQAAYPTAEMLVRRQLTRTEGDTKVHHVIDEELTERQRAALRAAYHADFFAWPRQATGEDLAAALDVSPPTFHQHLRKAERKVFDSLLSGGDPSDGQRA